MRISTKDDLNKKEEISTYFIESLDEITSNEVYIFGGIFSLAAFDYFKSLGDEKNIKKSIQTCHYNYSKFGATRVIVNLEERFSFLKND